MDEKKTLTHKLLSQWHDGDEKSLDTLIEHHLPWIRNHVHHRLGSYLRAKGETCDYVQDAVHEFLRYGPRVSISNDKQFRALFAKIAENTIRGKRDWFTAKRRHITRQQPFLSDTILSLDPPKAAVERPSQAADKNEREAWIRLGLELLDPEDSEVIILHQWEGLSFPRIGEELRISHDAARMRHARAVTRLSAKVAQLRGGDLARAVGDGLS